MQPMRKHVPPSAGSSSTHATFKPSCAARIAATYPPGPEPMTTTSCLADAISHLDQHACRLFDAFLDPLQKRHGLASVDDPMIVGQSDVHHRADHHLALARNRAIDNRVKPENPT